METYLLEQGADVAHLLKEEQSFSTVENLAYSKILIEKRENLLWQEPEQRTEAKREPRIGIITSNFHLCRAGMIAKKH